ncbi:hypothetical protein AQ490_14315 [Wenjunlia vitaminophila]|uniref:SseB protein N-terminal domain-containing protein n=1 Tax=Wenjunlia vitaminophila TaxID=76728 RepID=A0A0T6LX29_WENVI|nr:SseB family protein [Wenjunlia vitaminophila]KRV50284.1 hypothetical protein AQ490_14315 [Wenjunlia vitaminophila]
MSLKNVPDPGFAGDQGGADPGLARALEQYARTPDDGSARAVLEALSGARLLVPVVAVLGEVETGPDGLRREKTSDMAVPTLTTPDGSRALPAFTSLESLARWRPDARPVAVRTRQAVEAAYHEGADTLVIDLAGPATFQLSGAPMRALAQGREYLEPTRDPEVAEAVRTVLAAQPAVVGAHLVPGGGGDGTLGLVFAPGVEVARAAREVAGALAGNEVLRARLVHGLELAVLPPGTPLPARALFSR